VNAIQIANRMIILFAFDLCKNNFAGTKIGANGVKMDENGTALIPARDMPQLAFRITCAVARTKVQAVGRTAGIQVTPREHT